MTYLDLLESAMARHPVKEETLWKCMDQISNLMENLKTEYPKLYWDFLRTQHGLLYDGHYSEDFAEIDVTSKRWSPDEIEKVTEGFVFPDGTTKYDKYVAFNTAYADFCKVLPDEEILKAGYSFYFADVSWNSNTKVWDYICCKKA